MKFSKNQTRARPSQGGKFAAPVGPPDVRLTQADATGICNAQDPQWTAIILRNGPRPDWDDVCPAPPKQTCGHCGHKDIRADAAYCGKCGVLLRAPQRRGEMIVVDDELEREKKRLVGKRVRWSAACPDEAQPGRQVTSEPVQDVRRRDGVVVACFLGDGWCQSVEVEPIPEPLLFVDLALDERFCRAECEELARRTGDWLVKVASRGEGNSKWEDTGKPATLPLDAPVVRA